MIHTFAADNTDSTPLYVVEKEDLNSWLETQPEHVARWVSASGFTGGVGAACLVPDETGAPHLAVAGFGSRQLRARGRFALAAAAKSLPTGVYHIAGGLPPAEAEIQALGWLLESYRFDRYRAQSEMGAQLVAPKGVDRARIETMAEAEARIRDLINTPANDMGPEALEGAARALAESFGAEINVTTGAALLEQNLPMIHAVGRAASQAPRLIDMRWGHAGPRITLVGKGVCFDTGGLNLKPGGSMALMKKDMGGAANVIGLAHMIMALGVAVQLRVLIPAVENAVAGDAFRPGDILTSRKGLTVEINNTDAEGRLVLADALALADEEDTDLIVSMATLTGAARVAVGPDLAPFYVEDDAIAARLQAAADAHADPVWRMPFWDPYEAMIEPGIADLDNAPKGGFAGSITAALFLRRFVERAPYAHFDIYGWSPAAAPGRSRGGVGQGVRAILALVSDMDGA